MSRNWLREKSTWRADTPPSTCWSHSCGLLHSHPIKQDCQTVETASGPPTLPIKVTYKSCSFLFLLGYSAFLLLDSDTLSIWIQAKILTKNKCSVKKLVLMTELSTSEDAPPRWQPTNAEDCIFHQETCMMTHHRTILTKLSDLHSCASAWHCIYEKNMQVQHEINPQWLFHCILQSPEQASTHSTSQVHLHLCLSPRSHASWQLFPCNLSPPQTF